MISRPYRVYRVQLLALDIRSCVQVSCCSCPSVLLSILPAVFLIHPFFHFFNNLFQSTGGFCSRPVCLCNAFQHDQDFFELGYVVFIAVRFV
jgi:hypothetical protein